MTEDIEDIKQLVRDEMKKRIKAHPLLQKYVEEGIKHGLTEDETADTMIDAWLEIKGDKYDYIISRKRS